MLNDVDLDIFIDALEKSAPIWVKEMKSRGLLRCSLNRVWNQNDVHRLVMSYEYESKKAYLKKQKNYFSSNTACFEAQFETIYFFLLFQVPPY